MREFTHPIRSCKKPIVTGQQHRLSHYLMMMMFFCGVLHSPATAQGGLSHKGMRADSLLPDWYLDPLARVAWRKAADGWIPVDSSVRSISACNDFVVLNGHQLHERSTGKWIQDGWSVGCIDSIAWVVSRPQMSYFYADTGRVAFYSADNVGVGDMPNGDTVLGKFAFYAMPIAEWELLNRHMSPKRHGMLAMDGQWILPPVYERNFRFKNGLAVVYYQGQKRIINTLGEFVETPDH